MTDYRGYKIEVGDKGYVQLVDYMGNDKTVVNAARVSFGKNNDEPLSERDKKLISYLMEHRHTTPFEHVTFTFKVKVPMDIWRQWVRHRTASINEYSTRYSEAIEDTAATSYDTWRKQAANNRQGSDGFIDEEVGKRLTEREAELQALAREVYKERLEAGVAREQARKDLPLSTYTEAYWTINLHNLFHFLELRMSDAAQKEIREYADAIYRLVDRVCPVSTEAFMRLCFDTRKLNQFQLEVLKALVYCKDTFVDSKEVKDMFNFLKDGYRVLVRDGEYDELIDFMDRVGMIREEQDGEQQCD